MSVITDAAVHFVVPGDLHLTEAGLDNHRTAQWMVNEVEELIRPDFVQFIGDNAQNARPEEYQLFRGLCDRLTVPWFALAGDHDVVGDPEAHGLRAVAGPTCGTLSLRGFRFVRLNTVEYRPLGLSTAQITWFEEEVDEAHAQGERVLIFQHHYPFKVWEQFDGSGIEAWRRIVQARRITGIFTGHTHYGQVANDGRNVYVTTRSLGDPEGGPPGYTLAHVHGEDLAITYRSSADRGPIVLITHPRAVLLATSSRHIVSGPDRIEVRSWSHKPIASAQVRIDEGDWLDLEPSGPCSWTRSLPGERLRKGGHDLEARLVDVAGAEGRTRLRFHVDATRRYTPLPMVSPIVTGTAFC